MPIDVANGRSLSVPIVQAQVSAKSVAQLQTSVDATRPLAAYELSNSTGAGLSPGAVTLYTQATAQHSGTFLGDAQIGAIPRGQARLLSYAIHPHLSVLRDNPISREEQRRVAVEGASVIVTSLSVAEHRVRVSNTGPVATDVLIEMYRPSSDAELRAPTAQLRGDVGALWRVNLPSAAHTTTMHTLQVLRPVRSRESLQRLNIEQLAQYRDGASTDASRAVFVDLLALRLAERDARSTLDQAEQRIKDIERQQELTNDNLRPLGPKSPLRDQLEATQAKLQTELEQHIASRVAAQSLVRIADQALTRFFDARLKV